MIESLLVANRGEIARRIIRTAKRLGIRTIAVYSEADAGLPFVAEADEAVLIGPANPAQSYRNAEAILAAAKATGAEAIHPGLRLPVGERRLRPRGRRASGLIWVGPGAGRDHRDGRQDQRAQPDGGGRRAGRARHHRPGGRPWTTAVAEAARIGYPVMVKAAAGGGGMGMAVGRRRGGAAHRVRQGARRSPSGCSATARC